MNNEEIKEMLNDIAVTIGSFDGTVNGLLLINDYMMKLNAQKENTVGQDDVSKEIIGINRRLEEIELTK